MTRLVPENDRKKHTQIFGPKFGSHSAVVKLSEIVKSTTEPKLAASRTTGVFSAKFVD